jgi:hypothetical protein
VTRTLAWARWLAGAAIAAALPATFAIALAAIGSTLGSTTARAQGGLADIPLPPDEAEQKKILADVKAKALEYEQNLPDFVCTQFSHHNVDLKGTNQWKTLDTVSEQLRFVHHAEEYTLIAQNGKKGGGSEKRAPDLVSIKEFSDVLRYIFDPKAKVSMAWSQWDSVRGHRVHVIPFVVTKDNTLYMLGKSKPISSGLGGWVYADSDTNAVLRVAMAATDIPKTYPIQAVATDIVFDFVRIGDKNYLVPVKADLHEKQGKSQVWDEVEFKDFRKP